MRRLILEIRAFAGRVTHAVDIPVAGRNQVAGSWINAHRARTKLKGAQIPTLELHVFREKLANALDQRLPVHKGYPRGVHEEYTPLGIPLEKLVS